MAEPSGGSGSTFSAVEVDAAVVVPLRAAVLRPHLPPTESIYPADREPESRHYAVLRDGGPVAVGSSFRTGEGWRIRGMAVVESSRGRGLGGQVLEAIVDGIASRGGGLVWCNARVTAAGFYQRHGFTIVGGEFDLPEIGAHYRMERVVAGKSGGSEEAGRER